MAVTVTLEVAEGGGEGRRWVEVAVVVVVGLEEVVVVAEEVILGTVKTPAKLEDGKSSPGLTRGR